MQSKETEIKKKGKLDKVGHANFKIPIVQMNDNVEKQIIFIYLEIYWSWQKKKV